MDLHDIIWRLKWLPMCVLTARGSVQAPSRTDSFAPLVVLFAYSHNAYERTLRDNGERRSLTGYLRYLVTPREGSVRDLSCSPWTTPRWRGRPDDDKDATRGLVRGEGMP
jgi:hypothetical protein